MQPLRRIPRTTLGILLGLALAGGDAFAKDEAPTFKDYVKLRRRAEKAFAGGRYAEALPLFRQAMEIAPCDEAYVNVLRALRNLGRLRDAIALAEEAIASREARLNALVDRGMLMFQDRELFAEIVGSAAFLVWGCDARARRVEQGRSGGSLLAGCGGEEGARTIGALTGMDPDSYVLDRYERYLHEREDSGYHEPLVYEAAQDVRERRGELDVAREVARRAAADARVAEVERERGPTPFIPSPTDLENAAPKWLAVAAIYEESGFPESAAICRSRAKSFAELAAAAEAGLSRQEVIARRKAIHAAARSELGSSSGPKLSPRSIVSRPRMEPPGAGDGGEPEPAAAGDGASSRARWRHPLDDDGVAEQRVEVGTVVMTFEVTLVDHELSLVLRELSGPSGASVRLTSPDLPELSLSLGADGTGQAFALGRDVDLTGTSGDRELVLDFVVEDPLVNGTD